MSKSVNSKRIRLRNARLSFAQLYEAKPFRAGQDPRFQATFLLDPASKDCRAALVDEGQDASTIEWTRGGDAVKLIVGEAKRVMREMYGGNVNIDEIPKCLGAGDKLDKVPEGYAGMFYVRTYLHEKNGRPIVVNANRQPVAKASDVGAPYSGCYVNATVSLWAQNPSQWGKRLNGNLHAVQFAGEGEPFSGAAGVDIEEEFEALEGDDSDENASDDGWDI